MIDFMYNLSFGVFAFKVKQTCWFNTRIYITVVKSCS